MVYSLYELVNPFTNKVFYIGITSNPKIRLERHCCCSQRNWKTNHRKTKIIHDLKKQGYKPKMNILFADLSMLDAVNLEIDMIDKMKILGYELTNVADGGNMISKEIGEKISKALKGRKHTKETLNRMKIACAKRPPKLPHLEETKRKITESNIIYKFLTEEFLIDQFIKQNKSASIIAKENGIKSRQTVLNWIHKFKITRK